MTEGIKVKPERRIPSSSGETSCSKAETRRKMLEALARLEDEEEVASNHSETDNGDMMVPRGIAQAYANAYLRE